MRLKKGWGARDQQSMARSEQVVQSAAKREGRREGGKREGEEVMK